MSGFPWLTAVVVLPVAGAMLLQVIPGRAASAIKAVTVAFAAVEAVLVGMIVYAVATGAADGGGPLPMHLVEQAGWIPAIGASYHLGVDGISAWILALNAGVFLLGAVVVPRRSTERLKLFCGLLLLAEAATTGVLVSLDLLLFYLFWEGMLIPLYFLLAFYGNENRGRATLKFVIYTVAGSLLMLLAIIYLHFQALAAGHNSFDLEVLLSTPTPAQTGVPLPFTTVPTLTPAMFAFLAFALAFAIKLPIVPFHTWLPDLYEFGADPGPGVLRRGGQQDGGVRLHPLRDHPLRTSGPPAPAAAGGAGRPRHPLRGADGPEPDRPQADRRLRQPLPPQLHRARHLQPRSERDQRGGDPDRQPRHHHRRALPGGRGGRGAHRHPRHPRAGRAPEADALALLPLHGDHPGQPRAARDQRLRRRDHHHAGGLPVLLAAGGARRDGRAPRQLVHAPHAPGDHARAGPAGHREGERPPPARRPGAGAARRADRLPRGLPAPGRRGHRAGGAGLRDPGRRQRRHHPATGGGDRHLAAGPRRERAGGAAARHRDARVARPARPAPRGHRRGRLRRPDAARPGGAAGPPHLAGGLQRCGAGGRPGGERLGLVRRRTVRPHRLLRRLRLRPAGGVRQLRDPGHLAADRRDQPRVPHPPPPPQRRVLRAGDGGDRGDDAARPAPPA